MRDRLSGRLLLAGSVGVVLLVTWSAISGWWIATLKAVAFSVSGGGAVFGPPTASPTLAAVVVAILVLTLPLAERLRFASLTFAAALSAEFLVVVLGVILHVPPSAMPVLGGLAQDVVPVCGLLFALSRSEWRVW